MLYCAKCRKGLPDGTIFCDYCGHEIADGSSVTTAATLPDLRPGQRLSPPYDVARRASVAATQSSAEPAPPAIEPVVDEPAGDHERGQQTPVSLSTFPAAPARSPAIDGNGKALPPLDMERRPVSVSPGGHDPRSISDRVIQLQLGRDIFELSGQSTYLVGRRDLDQQLFPDVDLHEWDGAAAGVSRRHLMIRVIGNIVSIEDLESRNSTILNGYRLFPHQQYPLVDTDEVRMGDLTLLVRIFSSS